MDKIDLEELERLAKAAHLPWYIYKECQLDDHHEEIRDANRYYVKNLNDERDKYILAACNTVPELIARVQKLERQRDWLAKFIEDNLDCDMCPYSKGACTPQIPADCAERIKKAAKEGISNVQQL